VPRPLRREFPNHEVRTTHDMGWEDLSNGKLLTKAHESNFEIFLTVDQNLRYQQNLEQHPITIVVMVANGITVDDLKPLVLKVEEILAVTQPSNVYEVRSDLVN
jgi:hypothetical protein